MVAGPIPSAANLLLPLDPETAERVNRVNTRFVEAARKTRRGAEHDALIQHRHPPVNVVGGYKFAGAPAVDLSSTRHAGADVLPAEGAALIASSR